MGTRPTALIVKFKHISHIIPSPLLLALILFHSLQIHVLKSSRKVYSECYFYLSLLTLNMFLTAWYHSAPVNGFDVHILQLMPRCKILSCFDCDSTTLYTKPRRISPSFFTSDWWWGEFVMKLEIFSSGSSSNEELLNWRPGTIWPFGKFGWFRIVSSRASGTGIKVRNFTRIHAIHTLHSDYFEGPTQMARTFQMSFAMEAFQFISSHFHQIGQ